MSQRKSVAFQFSQDPNTIQSKDLDYAMYAGDVMPELTKDQLIDLIKNEYNVQLAEIESTLESLRVDKAGIESGRTKAQDTYGKLFQLERKLGDHYHELKAEMEKLVATKGEQGQKTSVLRNQIADLTDVRKTLQEQQAKEAKAIDANKLKELCAFMEKQNDPNICFIVDNMSCMLQGEAGATFANTKDKIWCSHDMFADKLRRMDNQKLPREWCEALMTEITGGKADGGKVAQALTDPENLSLYVPFYCFFKTLSKMVYCAMTQRKEINFKRKIASGGAQEDQVQCKIDGLQSQIDALNVRDIVKQEMERIYEGEKGWLDSKLAKADEEIAKYENMKETLVETYFGDLP